ncbi:fatty acyl-AMP ligase [Antrihabitans stalactiti]|uniref:Fatty acyl-AMP ligase n=1 Tax=Antrihabitans stalactiti TaxID=2584121 RepID=A0A848KEP6_9NOCA|nr:fatty acyl-AMP ligase [Antrihabitans stalactiti]NMN96779.1 fatty acyl-AMP ligase [Antrihabitans stalactiti]
MQQTFASHVRSQVERFGDDRRYTYLREVGRELTEDVVTYRGLDRDARAIAAWLLTQPETKRPVVLLYDTGLDFLRAFIGCIYAGVIAIPAPVPLYANGMRRVAGIFADADVAIVLTTAATRELLAAGLSDAGLADKVKLVATDDATLADPDAWEMPAIGPDTVAFLQYTSGSTGDPKGVVVTHGNLLHNTAAMASSFGADHNSVGIGWVPHFHDMGLIGVLLASIATGCDCVYMSPMTFLKRPIRLLEAIDKYRGTIMASPNFAYELIARRVKPAQLAGLDLSCMKTALNGAEPVRQRTIDTIADCLGPAGLRPYTIVPTYGLAEVTLLATVGRAGTPPPRLDVDAAALERNEIVPSSAPGALSLVSSGAPAEGIEVRIVHPQTLLDESGVGEIWLRGASVAGGYWKRPEQTRADFEAFVGTDGPYLRTGDLGFLSGGELFVTGRLKDLIIVNGRNLYPQDIEAAICESHPALAESIGIAVSIDAEDKERLLVILGVKHAAMAGIAHAELAAEIKAFASRTFDVPAPNVVFVEQRGIHRTTSGKVQRRSMKAAFLARALDGVLYEAIDPVVENLRAVNQVGS